MVFATAQFPGEAKTVLSGDSMYLNFVLLKVQMRNPNIFWEIIGNPNVFREIIGNSGHSVYKPPNASAEKNCR